MREFLASRRPTPAMAVAFIALLAALSGTAVALPGKNTVDSADIKNKQVKDKDLANNAVTAGRSRTAHPCADIGNDSLTGTDVNEATLGQVPSANTANTANSAANATRAESAERWTRSTPARPRSSRRGRRAPAPTRVRVTVTHPRLDNDADNVGESAFRFTTTEGAIVLGQVSTFLTGTT